MELYGNDTTDYDDWDNPIAGTARDPIMTYYHCYPKKVKAMSMFWLYVEKSDSFFWLTVAAFGLWLFVTIYLGLLLFGIGVPEARLILTIIFTTLGMPIAGLLLMWINGFRKWWKKRDQKKIENQKYGTEILLKKVDNALARYEKLLPKPVEKEPYRYAYLPAGVPVPVEAPGFKRARTGGGVPRF